MRPHWRERSRPGTGAAVAVAGEVYAPSVRAHSETVLRSFYDFHLEAGTGPFVNPFPLDRSRRGGRAHAHRNPMEPLPPRAQRHVPSGGAVADPSQRPR